MGLESALQMRLLRILIGYRDDLDLSAKWWHRLASVVFVLAFIAVIGIATFIAHDDKARRPRVSNVEILATINDVMLKDDKASRESYISDFQALAGEEGLQKGSGIEPIYFYSVKCFIAKLVKNADGTEVQPPKPEPFCFDESNSSSPATIETKDILKYRLTALGETRIWFDAVWTGFLWALALSIPLLTVYYRGLVYIVCGPRKKSTPRTPTPAAVA